MLSREEILSLLSHMGVDLPRKIKLPDAELDKRLSKALDSAQYLPRVLPDPPLDPPTLPLWFDTNSAPNKPVLEAIRRHNIAEATTIAQSQMSGIADPFPLFSNAFMDLRQTLMSIGNACDTYGKQPPVIIQNAEDTSGICMRILDVRKFDKETPILIVVYDHSVEDALSPGSFAWVSSYVSAGTMKAGMMAKITATVQEQQLLLRILKQNSKRLARSYKPKRAPTESAFTLSFLLPVGPLPAKDLAKYNTNDGCSVCGDPAKQKCSRCGAARYCGQVCQKDDWKAHRRLCDKLQGAAWQPITFLPAGQYGPGVYSVTISRFDIVQHRDLEELLSTQKQKDTTNPPAPPENTHGASPFIVKVQVQSSNARGPAHTYFEEIGSKQPAVEGFNVMIYDQRRALDVIMLRDSSPAEEYAAIVDLVREKGDRGIKLFCWAVRTGEWTLNICRDQFPEWQKW